MHYKLKSKQTADPNVNKAKMSTNSWLKSIARSCHSMFEFWPFYRGSWGCLGFTVGGWKTSKIVSFQVHSSWKFSKIVSSFSFQVCTVDENPSISLIFVARNLSQWMGFGAHSGWNSFKKSQFLVQKITTVDENCFTMFHFG